MKTLYDVVVEKGLTTKAEVLEFVSGKKAKIIEKTLIKGPTSGHSYPANLEFYIKKYSPTHSDSLVRLTNTTSLSSVVSKSKTDLTSDTRYGSNIYLHEIEYLDSYSKLDLHNQLVSCRKEYEEKIKDLERKLKILDDLGLEEYNDKLIKVANTIIKCNNKISAKEAYEIATTVDDIK